MATARANHTATLLASGNVLVVGGASAEVYDPTTNSWSPAGTLTNARSQHTATLLPSGKVLVAGGFIPGSGSLTSSELYDPTLNTWTPTGSLMTARFGHSATLLPSGKVLAAGGNASGDIGITSSAELYNPSTNMWTATGALFTLRDYHTATLLFGGAVLADGGLSTSGVGSNTKIFSVASAELFTDVGTGGWAPASALASARYYHTATLLPSGVVLAAAGLDDSAYGLASAELYNPATNTWTGTGALADARYLHTATLLLSGKVLVAGGFGNSNRFPILASAELYDPAAATVATTSLATSCMTTFLGNQLFTMTASVNGAAPTGSVSFTTQTNVALCANVSLSSGNASCTTSALSVAGSATEQVYSLTANYSGDAGNTPSTSAAITVTALNAGEVIFRNGLEFGSPSCPIE